MQKRSILCSLLAALAISVTGSLVLAQGHLQVPVLLGVQEPPKAVTPLPIYFLEPPDVINVEAVHLVPKAPYRLRVFDIIAVVVGNAPPSDPISGPFAVEPGGAIQLGSVYGAVKVEGMSIEEAREAITQHLKGTSEASGKIEIPIVSVRLARMGDMQQIAGNHTIGPDGYITLGHYGRVYVNGLTLDECRNAIEFHLSKHLEHPQVAVDVFSYNSKAYYVIFPLAHGERIIKFPHTGNDGSVFHLVAFHAA